MATPQASADRTYLFRLQTLVIEGGLMVLRNLFEQKLNAQNISLSACLALERPSIVRLKSKKTITTIQYDMLYPQTGQPPSTADFDITLTICLLRTLKYCGLNSKFDWNVTPQIGDTSVEADIYRLKAFRNELAHISTTSGIQLQDFLHKWAEMEQILLRLNTSVQSHITNLKQIIDNFKTRPLDPKAEKSLQKEIDKWRKLEKGLEVDLQLVKEDTQVLKKDFQTVKRDVQAIKDDTVIKEAMTVAQKDIQTLKEDDNLVKQEVAKIPSIAKDLKDVQTNLTSLKEQFTSRKIEYQELEQDLIAFYLQQYSTLPLSPLTEEENTPLLEFYIIPEMNSVEFSRFLGGRNEQKRPVNSLSDVFYKNNNLCREIYLSADAGLGKTAFSNRLALTWCHAKEPMISKSEEQINFDEDIKTMAVFDFVFLLPLRECLHECEIDNLILNHIIPKLAHTSLTLTDLENIISEKKCLVILDGLDEWSHTTTSCKQGPSDIPHRKARECTILTTTRPWKLSAINLKSSRIDRNVELVGLNATASFTLKRRVILQMSGVKDESTLQKLVQEFSKAVNEKGISDLEAIPLMLMYLLCLWCDEIELGGSQSELYCKIIEMLLSRTIRKHKYVKPPEEHVASTAISQCFSEEKHCKTYYTLLTALGQLAFQTLFSHTKEETLVFNSSLAEQYLNENDLKVGLLSGLITQSKSRAKITKQNSKISFAHKTIQEFFAALYMDVASNRTEMLNLAFSKCNSIDNVLEMSKVFVFLSGINAQLLSTISKEIMQVTASDNTTRRYRTLSVHRFYEEYQPLKDIQDMYLSCINENEKNSNLWLEDIFIHEDCQNEKYSSKLRLLTKANRENIKSLCIEDEGMSGLHKVIDFYELENQSGLVKMFYRGKFGDSDVPRIFSDSIQSLQCLTLHSCDWQEHDYTGVEMPLSQTLSRSIQSMHKLQAICLYDFKVNHNQLKDFLNYVTGKLSKREIILDNIHCSDHGASCKGCSLDLSQHSSLRALSLNIVPLSHLSINVSSLEFCKVGQLSTPGLVRSYLSYLPAANKLTSFWCSPLDSVSDIEKMLEILPLLIHLEDIRMRGVELGDRSLALLSGIVNIKFILFINVAVSNSSFLDMVKVIENLPHPCSVEIRDCNITPEIEFQQVKTYIQTSEFVNIYSDGMYGNTYKFGFKR